MGCSTGAGACTAATTGNTGAAGVTSTTTSTHSTVTGSTTTCPRATSPAARPPVGKAAARVDDRRYLLPASAFAEGATKAGGAAAQRCRGQSRPDDFRACLDDSLRVRGRADSPHPLDRTGPSAKLAPATRAPPAMSGRTSTRNGLTFEEYDAIRWLVARHAWRLAEALGEAPALPVPAPRRRPGRPSASPSSRAKVGTRSTCRAGADPATGDSADPGWYHRCDAAERCCRSRTRPE